MTPADQAAAPHARLPGLRARLLAMPLALGRFGLLALFLVRQAVAAARCVQAASGLLTSDAPWPAGTGHPAAHPLCLVESWGCPRRPTAPPSVGSWAPSRCWGLTCPWTSTQSGGPGASLPLYVGNPAVVAADGSCLEAHFPVLFLLRGLTTVGVWPFAAGPPSRPSGPPSQPPASGGRRCLSVLRGAARWRSGGPSSVASLATGSMVP